VTPEEASPLADRIEVRGLHVLVYCGVLAEEQERKQPFDVDLDIYLDLGPASTTDDLGETVNYGATISQVTAMLDRERFQLLERMAGRVAEVVLEDPNAVAVTVTARKMRPPVPSIVATTGVRIHRARR
jgi:dihydroneopterin aldolase